jgi:hypothetical protein
MGAQRVFSRSYLHSEKARVYSVLEVPMGPSGLSALSFCLDAPRAALPSLYATFSNTTAFQMKSRS